jgi:CheY-like chemotaxis protein
MKKKLNYILLIDDNASDNRYHKIVLEELDVAERVVSFIDGFEAIQSLMGEGVLPDLIFLDINMPKMNGWEFLEKYKQLGFGNQNPVVSMLTTSENPADLKRAEEIKEVKAFIVKPLSEVRFNEIIELHFPKNPLKDEE